MRIIAGLYRGRTLKTLKGREVRPTSDRLRETLFDILGAAVEGSVFVDAYAGSGAIGLEAVSRGARHVALIEQSEAAARMIQSNAVSLGVVERVDLIRSPVRKGIRLLAERGLQADFCFLDPPYDAPRQYAQGLRWLSESRLMAPGGMIIVQHSRKQAPAESASPWRRVRLILQGSNALSFYRAAEESAGE